MKVSLLNCGKRQLIRIVKEQQNQIKTITSMYRVSVGELRVVDPDNMIFDPKNNIINKEELAITDKLIRTGAIEKFKEEKTDSAN